MALSDSKLLIRDYENIRHILRDVYIYGCFSREDFVSKGISGRKYDNEQRRITAYLPKDFIQKRRENKKIILHCVYDKKESFANKMAETYRNKSFTLFDIIAYFFVLQILSDVQKLTVTEILERMPNYNEECLFTSATLRTKLDELEKVGLVFAEKRDGNVFYSLGKDIWAVFSDDELLDIYQYISFVRNTATLEIPFFFLQQKLKLYLEVNRKIDLDKICPIYVEHNHLFNALDDEVLLEILSAIRQRKKMNLVVKTLTDMYETDVIPVEVIHDSIYGRKFLLCKNLVNRNAFIIRIDRILRIKILDDISHEDRMCISELKYLVGKCWSVSGMEQPLTKVIIEFHIKECENFVLRRLEREKQNGVLVKMQHEVYRYEIEVGDPTEMIPWIRSFGERAKVVSSGTYKIEEKMKENWKRAVEKYEAFS